MPPKCRFTAPVFHPNVSAGGLVCAQWLSPYEWNMGTTLKEVLLQIQRLLVDPDMEYFVNTDAWQVRRSVKVSNDQNVLVRLPLIL